jgi:hypothetical protein
MWRSAAPVRRVALLARGLGLDSEPSGLRSGGVGATSAARSTPFIHRLSTRLTIFGQAVAAFLRSALVSKPRGSSATPSLREPAPGFRAVNLACSARIGVTAASIAGAHVGGLIIAMYVSNGTGTRRRNAF